MIVLPPQALKKHHVSGKPDSKEIETTLHQIATGLQRAAEGYLTLASHISKVTPYELPHVIAQIPPPLWMFLCLLGKLYW